MTDTAFIDEAPDLPPASLCASCGASCDTATCSACGHDSRLDGRYRLTRRLGHGAVGTTYAAIRERDGQAVAIKEMLVRRLDDFKTLDLFKREADILRLLDHPAIPRYYDSFSCGQGRQTGLYLVTELIDGDTLEHELTTRRLSQRDVLAIIRELCDVLTYLHTLAPAVVHRDLKPSNVMRRRDDGRLVLIDFGAVKETLRATDGSTVAGTFGYMPPEQLAGRATPASDVYALGVMWVALLTGLSPQDLLDDQNRLQWREHITSAPTKALLGLMLEPDPQRRLGDIEIVARRLDDIIAGRAAPNVGVDTQVRGLAKGLPNGIAELLQSVLGAVSGTAPGAADPPPPTPRELPRRFVSRAEPLGSFFRIFGVMFGGIPLLMTGVVFSHTDFIGPGMILWVFVLIGGVFATIGFRRVARVKRLFRHGIAVPAVVTESWLNTSLVVNGRSPFKITFRFETLAGDPQTVTISRFNMLAALRSPGAQVYALYDEKNPSRATLWPL